MRLMAMLFGLGVMVRSILNIVGEGLFGRQPVVALFLHFPWLGFAAFETHIGARIGGAAIADFVPSPGMRIVCVDGVAGEQLPEAMHRHAGPDVFSSDRAP